MRLGLALIRLEGVCHMTLLTSWLTVLPTVYLVLLFLNVASFCPEAPLVLELIFKHIELISSLFYGPYRAAYLELPITVGPRNLDWVALGSAIGLDKNKKMFLLTVLKECGTTNFSFELTNCIRLI